MRKFIQPSLTLIAILALLSGCDIDWGEEFKSFAEQNAYPLSRKFANSDLKRKWQAAFQEYTMSLTTSVNLAATRINAASTEDVPGTSLTGEELFYKNKRMHLMLSGLIPLESQLEDIAKRFSLIGNICDNRGIFTSFGLEGSVMRSILNVAAPRNKGLGFCLAYSSGDDNNAANTEMAVCNGKGIFDFGHFRKQEKRFKDGQYIIQRDVIYGEELFLLSRKICKGEQKKFQKIIASGKATIAKIKEAIDVKRRLFYKQVEEYEAYLMPQMIENFLKRTGGWDTLREFEEQGYRHKMDADLDNLAKALDESYLAISGGKSKKEVIVNLDRHRDYLHTSLIQLRKYLPLETMPKRANILKILIKGYERELKEANEFYEFAKKHEEERE